MSNIEPTIGRMVHYKDAEDKTLPAVITKVNDEGAVFLQVFGIDKVYPAHVVTRGEGQLQWSWPEYIKKQDICQQEDTKEQKKLEKKLAKDKKEDLQQESTQEKE